MVAENVLETAVTDSKTGLVTWSFERRTEPVAFESAPAPLLDRESVLEPEREFPEL